ncbi:hypothetical protein WA158_004836 [Blastocystis sp. Blastoise]
MNFNEDIETRDDISLFDIYADPEDLDNSTTSADISIYETPKKNMDNKENYTPLYSSKGKSRCRFTKQILRDDILKDKTNCHLSFDDCDFEETIPTPTFYFRRKKFIFKSQQTRMASISKYENDFLHEDPSTPSSLLTPIKLLNINHSVTTRSKRGFSFESNLIKRRSQLESPSFSPIVPHYSMKTPNNRDSDSIDMNETIDEPSDTFISQENKGRGRARKYIKDDLVGDYNTVSKKIFDDDY